jgi:hypothetical protein
MLSYTPQPASMCMSRQYGQVTNAATGTSPTSFTHQAPTDSR